MSDLEQLKQIFEKLNAMMHIKGNLPPDKTWEEKYNFLERRAEYLKKKLKTPVFLRWKNN